MRDEEAILRCVFDTAEAILIVFDAQGRVVRMNPAAETILGYSVSEAAGRHFWDIFIAPEEREQAQQRFAAVCNGNWPRQYDREWVNRYGVRRHIRWTTGRIRGADGTLQYIIGSGIDITESRQAARALEDQTHLLRSVLDSIGDGVAAADLAGNYLIYTQEAGRVVERAKPTVPLDQLSAYYGFHHPDASGLYPNDQLPMMRAFRGEPCNNVELLVRRPDLPEDRYCSVNGRPLRDKEGKIFGGVIASRDITERKIAEREILFRKSLLEAQLEGSIDGILVVDLHGNIVLSNRRFMEMWDLTDEDVKTGFDKHAVAAVLDRVSDPAAFASRIRYLYEHPEEFSRDIITLKDGRTFDRYSAPVRSPMGSGGAVTHHGRLWIFRDITELKQAEATARRSAELARENAAHYRELAEHTRRLAREIDHRVGNNLAGLLGLLAVARTRATSVDALAEAIENRVLAMAQVHRLLRQGNWSRISLNDLIGSARLAVDQLLHQNVTFIAQGEKVLIEPPQISPLTMVLVELMTNSAKHGVYSSSGGTLTLTWNLRPAPSGSTDLQLRWTERGGPPIERAGSPSLGTELVEGFVTRELRGRVTLRYPREGADHTIEFPLQAIPADSSAAPSEPEGRSMEPNPIFEAAKSP